MCNTISEREKTSQNVTTARFHKIFFSSQGQSKVDLYEHQKMRPLLNVSNIHSQLLTHVNHPS